MSGIIGVVADQPVNQIIYDSLLLLQHRGQDSAGIATADGSCFNMHKSHGLVRDVFRTRNMRALPGNSGLGHVRYPGFGATASVDEAQPLYVNAPFGITFVHNGNLTNWQELREALFRVDHRHINTNADSEVLLNVFAHELHRATHSAELQPETVFQAVASVHQRAKGAYAVIAQIANHGMVAFRDPYGIRPLCIGKLETPSGTSWMIASESVAITGCGYSLVRDVAPGEAVFIDLGGQITSRQCADSPRLAPCAFEYVYFARPDSVMDGVPVYDARLNMGEALAEKVAKSFRLGDIDVVMPVPDSSRPSAMQLASRLDLIYREGLIKNRYVGRTFIMPGQTTRERTIRQKLSAMELEFVGKNILLVDDSIVRGNTSRQIVEMARQAGAHKVYFASAAPAVRYPNVYGIDLPMPADLVATGRSNADIADEIGVDGLVFQDLAALRESIRSLNTAIEAFDTSCFDGYYLTGDVDASTLERMAIDRAAGSAGEMVISRSPD